MKKLICVLLAAVLCLGLLGAGAPSKMPVEADSVAYPYAQTDNDALFAGYVDMLFYGDRGGEPPQSVGGASAGSLLEGDNRLVYNALVQEIKKIASGERASTVISIGQPMNGVAADVYAEFSGGIEGISLRTIHKAILADCAYELYWYDKTAGCSMEYYTGTPVPQIILYFNTADAYVGEDYYHVDTAKTGAASKAADNAKSVVACYSLLSDYRKLLAYKDYICAAVDYNDEAAKGGVPYGDPWQLIHVFDGDDTTKVVCEGYSKAFQYLCDMSKWSGSVNCYTVNGYMGGAHMWNIVSVDGANYLVDVTNSDEGTVGQSGELFLAGSGKEISGDFTTGSGTITMYGYRFRVGEGHVYYYYDSNTIWGESVLRLVEDDYVPPVELESISLDKTQLSLEPGRSETLTAILTPADKPVELEWSSSNTDVAVVEKGVVTAVAPGSAAITVSAEGLSASCTVTVDALYACTKNGDGSLTVSLPSNMLEQTRMLIVAGYENGRMCDYRIVTEAEWTNTLSVEGAQFKVIVLGEGYMPLEQFASPME